MKKIALTLAVLTLSTTLLAGCGKFTCALCNEEKSGKKYKSELAEDAYICEDCHKEAEALKEDLEELGEELEKELKN